MIDRRALLAAVTGTVALAGCGAARQRTDGPDGESPDEGPASDPAAAVAPHVTGVIAEGLNVPWGIAFLKDGRALVAQRDAGSIVVVDSTAANDKRVVTVGRIDAAVGRRGGEGGVLGLALDPEDARSLYAYVTTEADDRILRIEFDGERLSAGEPVLTGIRVGARHHGGRMVFGPDGHLYVGTGEAGLPEQAQDPDALGGKILRLDRDGNVQRWSMGHRNVEGLAFDDQGRLWATEFGNHRYDELNLIRRGGNYGWPEVEGDEGAGEGDHFIRPKITWSTTECSPAGLAIARSTAFIAALRGERLWTVPLAGTRVGKPRAHFVGRYGRLRTVAAAPDGSLWLTTSNTDGRGTARGNDDRILRVSLD